MLGKKKESLLIKIIVIMVTLVAASYAWFTNGARLKIDGLSITTRAVQNLSFSLDGGITWDDETSLNMDENFKFNSEITGNGINLYVPSTRREDGTPVSFRNATRDKDYLEFEIRFKSDNPVGIFLDNDSFILPTAGDKESDLIGSNVIRKSSAGDYTRDLIAGGVRVAFIENDITEDVIIPQAKTKLVWAPNSNYQLVKNKSNYQFLLNSTDSQDYSCLNPSTLEKQVVPNLKDKISASYSKLSTGGDPMLTYIQSKDEIKSITVRIWVEGNDRETDTSLKGGIFRIFFNFIGINKKINTNIPNTTIYNNTMSGFTKDMEYSIDYGNHWITYQDNTNPIFGINATVYVRYQETFDLYPSEYQILNY